MQRWLDSSAGLAQRIAEKLLDVVNNKYDLLIDTLDRLAITAIVSNAIDATSGGKVKALIIAHGYSTASSIAGVANRLIGEKIYQPWICRWRWRLTMSVAPWLIISSIRTRVRV